MNTALAELARLGMNPWVKAPGKIGLKKLRPLDSNQTGMALSFAREHKDNLLQELSSALRLNERHRNILSLLWELNSGLTCVTRFGLCEESRFRERIGGTAEEINISLDELIQAGKVEAIEESFPGTTWIELPEEALC